MRYSGLVWCTGALVAGLANSASAIVCVVPDDGTGTAQLPPNCGGGYQSPDDVHMIIDGLPPGTTIVVDASHEKFGLFNQGPGGSFPGGEFEQFNSGLIMNMMGAGLNRFMFFPVQCETHIAHRIRGTPVQDFDTLMFSLQGQIIGDPDFDLLRITGGNGFGMPSPGHTTLTRQGPNWAVDSFFDITYRIDFVGAPGGPLGGRSGSTTGTIRMALGGPFTVACCFPSGGCQDMSPGDCINAGGSPQAAGSSCTSVSCAPNIEACCLPNATGGPDCVNIPRADCVAQGGAPQGAGSSCSFTTEACCLPSGACIDVDKICCDDFGGTPQGPGSNCANADCAPPECEPLPDLTACRDTFCPPDPTGIDERCVPRCVRFNPATGQSQVVDCDCRNPNECHAVFPVPGTGAARGGGNPCVVTGNGGGTVTLPPAGCEYLSPDEVHMIIDGLPAGTTIILGTIHRDFICNRQPGAAGVCSHPLDVDCDEPGGSLGGQQECADSTLALNISCAGPCPAPLGGLNRNINLPISFETHVGPRMPGDPVQSFDTDMFRLFGQIANIGDPDFDLLRIVGGTDFGLPSPGHTTLTNIGGNQWAVDSFFDITYRIDFVGAPGGRLAGRSGSTTGTIRMATGGGPSCEGGCPAGTICRETRTVDATGAITVCCDCVTPPQEACCLTTVPGGCAMMDPLTCQQSGGVPQGPGSVCTAPEACCFPTGGCTNIDPLCCDDIGGVPQGAGSVCNGNLCPGQCPDLLRAASRKCCDLPINLSPPPITSEPRQGGIGRVVFTYSAPPVGVPTPIIESDCTCPPPPAFGPYGGPSTIACVQAANDLICTLSPPLPGPCTYQFRVCSGGGVVPVRLRSLLGDVNDSGMTDAIDRSVVVGVWTGSGYSCKTDLDCNGATNATDRSIVVGAWTSGANCAP